MTDPVEMYFPSREIESIREGYNIIYRRQGRRRIDPRYLTATGVMREYEKSHYGFLHYFHAGIYAPTSEEKAEQNIAAYNCTTIIVPLFLFAESMGLNPQIVQFKRFKDVYSNEENDDEIAESHFALVVDVGRKHPYIIDTFWSCFGPILKQEEHAWRIGSANKYHARTRRFQSIAHYTKEQFAQMLFELRDPATSLDMLVAGQELDYLPRPNTPFPYQYMVHYDDEKHRLSVLLYAPEVGRSDKAVYCHMNYNTEGNLDTTTVELFFAESRLWHNLKNPTLVAQTTIPELRAIQRILGRIKPNQRYAAKVNALGERQRATLMEIVQAMYDRIEPHEGLHARVLMRAAYEETAPSEEYVYSEDRRKDKLREQLAQHCDLFYKNEAIIRRLMEHFRKLTVLSSREYRDLRKERMRLCKKMNDLRADDLDSLYLKKRQTYDRMVDQVYFAEEHPLAEVMGQKHDLLLGYLAMVADFIPIILENQKRLQLVQYQQDLQKRIKARIEQQQNI
jgi:hypothetical protein